MITLTPKAQQVITVSKTIAQDNNHRFIGTEHLLLAIIDLKIGQGIDALERTGIRSSKLQRDLMGSLETVATTVSIKEISFSPRAQKAISEAAMYVSKFKQVYVGTEHLVLGILDEASANVTKALNNQGITPNDIRLAILEILKGESKNVAMLVDEFVGKKASKQAKAVSRKAQADSTSMISLFTRDLTLLAAEGRLEKTIGREYEMDRCIEVLMRYSKNNPIFIGEAGVGKTAVVEGIAKKIVEGNVPDQLLTLHIYQLDITMLVAGTRYRGDLEERIKMLLEEVQADPNNVLFIDEIHMIVGAGSADSSMDIGNILKPALSRGELTCIGATTISEYREYFESDSALQRRFQPITVDEPDTKETLNIIKGIKQRYENHHNVRYSQVSLRNIVELCDKYITDRNFPDKAIDVMDEIGSHVRAKIFNELFDTDIDTQLNKLEKTKLKLITNKDYDAANDIKKEQEKLLHQYDLIYNDWLKRQTKPTRIKEEDVLNYMSNITGMPITRLQLRESSRLKNLKNFLTRRIVGQNKATSVISAAIKRARVGLNDPNRPLCSFLFLGPTGVGKTHSAKIMGEYLFNNDNIIQVNMSECSESHSISKLIGAPPGYVGYNETGLLTEGVKRNPYSIVLLDEIEKAHPDVIQVLLQLLEEGTVVDSTGEEINFKHSIIIMTGNIGSEFLEKPNTIGFASADYEDINSRQKVNEELTKFFRPELVNRIDEIVIFDKLEEDSLIDICKLHIKQLITRLKKKKLSLNIDDRVYEFIVSQVDNNKFGARPVRRSIAQHIEDKICDKLISSPPEGDQNYNIDVLLKDDNIQIKLTRQKDPVTAQ